MIDLDEEGLVPSSFSSQDATTLENGRSKVEKSAYWHHRGRAAAKSKSPGMIQSGLQLLPMPFLSITEASSTFGG